MKFLHISDLHLGKRLHEFSLAEDQKYILAQILTLVETEKPQAVLICGDIYDKAVPPVEAVQLFDAFVTRLSALAPVLMIHGNHDSAERVSFGAALLSAGGVHVSPVYDGQLRRLELEDEWGPVQFWLMPYLRPAAVRRYFPDSKIECHQDAVRAVLGTLPPKMPGERRVLLAHQFVTGAQRSDSEEIYVGGQDNVDAALFEGFDYVALGHLHRPQSMDGGRLHYSGSPLAYDFSEAGQPKGVTLVELGAANDTREPAEADSAPLSLRPLPLIPLRALAVLRGTYSELCSPAFYQGLNREDFFSVRLTDREEQPEVLAKLRVIYPNILQLSYERPDRAQEAAAELEMDERMQRSPLELFAALYERQQHQPLSEAQRSWLSPLIQEIWEERA